MESEESDDELDAERARLEASVGEAVHLKDWSGISVGHDASWKGSKVTRCVVIQSGGVGTDRYTWGNWWGRALGDLGADVAAIVETCISGAGNHAAACRGMADAGFSCVSHNVEPNAAGSPNIHCDPRSAGVALAVRQDVAEGWCDVTKESHGRAVAASLQLQSGAVLRIVAVYGPTGACLPSFPAHPEALKQEEALCGFIEQEVERSTSQDWSLLIMGDFNSFTDGALDKWQGVWQVRDQCLAMRCKEAGLQDTWRLAHPRLQAFTYVSNTGSASRLDQIWMLPAVGAELHLLNATILWNWPRRIDHHPVLIDLTCVLPTLPPASSSDSAPMWKRLVKLAEGPNFTRTQAEVARALAPYENSLRAAGHTLQLLLHPASTSTSSSATWSEHGIVSWARGLPEADAHDRDTLAKVRDEVMSILWSALPQPSLAHDSRHTGRSVNAWDECIAHLRALRHLLEDAPDDSIRQEPVEEQLTLASAKWRQGLHHMRHGTGKLSPTPRHDWDGFHSNPGEWLQLRAPPGVYLQTASSSSEQAQNQAHSILLGWPSEPTANLASSRLESVKKWTDEATQLRASAANGGARLRHERRVLLLRQNDLKMWAKHLRDARPPNLRYTPTKLRTDSGVVRPSIPEQMRRAAAQEWQVLFSQPSTPWSHPTVTPWVDAAGRLRGSPATY